MGAYIYYLHILDTGLENDCIGLQLAMTLRPLCAEYKMLMSESQKQLNVLAKTININLLLAADQEISKVSRIHRQGNYGYMPILFLTPILFPGNRRRSAIMKAVTLLLFLSINV